MMTQDSSEVLEKHASSGSVVRGSSEYIRLVISDEQRVVEAETLLTRAESRIKSFWWWMKSFLWCVIFVFLAFILVKWGVSLFFEKVFPLTLQLFWYYCCMFCSVTNWYCSYLADMHLSILWQSCATFSFLIFLKWYMKFGISLGIEYEVLSYCC